MDNNQLREWAERNVERRHGRPMFVDGNQKGITAAIYALVGLGALGIVTAAYIPWWGLALAPVVVWFCVRRYHKEKSLQMRHEVEDLIRQQRST